MYAHWFYGVWTQLATARSSSRGVTKAMDTDIFNKETACENVTSLELMEKFCLNKMKN